MRPVESQRALTLAEIRECLGMLLAYARSGSSSKCMTRRQIAFVAVVPVIVVGGMILFWKDRVTASPDSRVGVERPIDSGSREPIVVGGAAEKLLAIQTVRPATGPLNNLIRANGTVTYDETRLVDVNSKIEGWIRELDVNYTGQAVKRDQGLFRLYSPDLISTQTQLIAA